MTNCKLVNFELGDLDYFTPYEEFPDLAKNMIHNIQNPYRFMMSFVDPSGEVHAICGVNSLRPEAVEIWSIRGIKYKDHKYEYFKELKKYIHNGLLSEDSGVQRIEIGIKNTEPDFFKWAEKLGGKFECEAKKYAKGEDHHVFVILRED